MENFLFEGSGEWFKVTRLGNTGKNKHILKLSIWEISIFPGFMCWNLIYWISSDSTKISKVWNLSLDVVMVIKVLMQLKVMSRKGVIWLLCFSVIIRLDQDAWKLTATICFMCYRIIYMSTLFPNTRDPPVKFNLKNNHAYPWLNL